MQQNELEKMLKQVLRMKTEVQLSLPPGPNCLSDEQLEALSNGILAESQRFAAIKHLCACAHCRTDLQFYFDSKQSETKVRNKILPEITVSLNGKVIKNAPINWIKPNETFEIWEIELDGLYELTVGSHSIVFDCEKKDIIKRISRPGLKAAATDDLLQHSKEVVSSDGSLVVRVYAGKYSGKFETVIKI